jgi:hypothetical protein
VLVLALPGVAVAAVVLRDAWLTPGTVATIERLGLAAIAGLALTLVQRHVSAGRTTGRPLERAQVLLAVAGALTMILVDNSVARAFGIAGAASIVRFRTPVDDPVDITVLFLSMGLGMCSGVGAFGLATIGAVMVGLLLEVMTTRGSGATRQCVTIELVSSGPGFPMSHVTSIFARHDVQAELAEWKQTGEIRVRYRALTTPSLCFEEFGRDLMACPGVGAVSWEVRRHAG